MDDVPKTVLLCESDVGRRRLYAHHAIRLGARVTLSSDTRYDVILASMPDLEQERLTVISLLARLPRGAPVVVLDNRPYNDEEFSTVSLRAHILRADTSLRHVFVQLAELLAG